MSGNYPPGTSAGDPRAPWNDPGPDRDHEHCWRPANSRNHNKPEPVFEDFSAIFEKECTWAPTKDVGSTERLGTVTEQVGPECEATRSTRFDASYVWYPNGQGAPVRSIFNNADVLSVEMEQGLIEVERAARDGKAEFVEVDPDPELGKVRVRHDGWEVVYKP